MIPDLRWLATDDQHGTHIEAYICPECGGALEEEHAGDLLRFRCHVGHELSERELLRAQGEEIERALWTALRVLEERYQLVNRTATRAQDLQLTNLVNHYREQRQEILEHAEVNRKVLIGDQGKRPVTVLQDEPPTQEATGDFS